MGNITAVRFTENQALEDFDKFQEIKIRSAALVDSKKDIYGNQLTKKIKPATVSKFVKRELGHASLSGVSLYTLAANALNANGFTQENGQSDKVYVKKNADFIIAKVTGSPIQKNIVRNISKKKNKTKKSKNTSIGVYQKAVEKLRIKRGGYIGFSPTYLYLCKELVGIEVTDSKKAKSHLKDFLSGGVKKSPNKKIKEYQQKIPEVAAVKTEPYRHKLLGKKEYGAFYSSTKWRQLRYLALKNTNGSCQCCGANASDEVQIHVDHIKPRSRYPELELSLDNLQVLCSDCNVGKGDWDNTNWKKHFESI